MIQPMCEHGLNGLIAGIRCNFFPNQLRARMYTDSIARREPRRLPACLGCTLGQSCKASALG